MKKVFISGSFDLFHSGHIAFLEEAAKCGLLYVAIGSDQTMIDLKGRPPINNEQERLYAIQSNRDVHRAFISSGSGILDFEKELEKIKPDFFVVNEDGNYKEKEELCKKLNIKYIVLKRLPIYNFIPRSTTDLRKIGVYCIRNMHNNKKYIGSSENLWRRLHTHFLRLNGDRHENKHLQYSWNKYDNSNFEFYILEKCPTENLVDREDFYIIKYNTLNSDFGYNKTSADRQITTEETRKKISNALKGKCSGDNNGFFGKHHTPHSKKLIAKANDGRMNGKTAKKISETLKGHTVSQEIREKISNTLKEKWKNDKEYRKKVEKTTFKKGNIPWNKKEK